VRSVGQKTTNSVKLKFRKTSCEYCKGSHNFKDCDKLKLDRRAAKLSKKNTYTEALVSSNAMSKVEVLNTYAKGRPICDTSVRITRQNLILKRLKLPS
jgi:hypothetical protein